LREELNKPILLYVNWKEIKKAGGQDRNQSQP